MNKKDLSELKKAMKAGTMFTINKIFTACFNGEMELTSSQLEQYSLMEEGKAAAYLAIAQKSLSGSIGKALNEYEFPDEANESNSPRDILYKTLTTRFKTETDLTKIADLITVNMEYEEAFMLTVIYCTYSVPSKNKNDEVEEDAVDSEEYNFFITAICPMHTGDIGLYLNANSKQIEKKTNCDLIVNKAPSDAFLFPIFTDRQSDINNVLYYTSKPKKPNKSIIEKVLGCKFILSAEDEKKFFNNFVSALYKEDLDYSKIIEINKKIEEMLAAAKNDPSPLVIGVNGMQRMFSSLGLEQEKINSIPAIYEEYMGNKTNEIRVANMTDLGTTKIKCSDVDVSIKSAAVNNIVTDNYHGKKSVIITLDESSINVNGVEIKV